MSGCHLVKKKVRTSPTFLGVRAFQSCQGVWHYSWVFRVTLERLIGISAHHLNLERLIEYLPILILMGRSAFPTDKSLFRTFLETFFLDCLNFFLKI